MYKAPSCESSDKKAQFLALFIIFLAMAGCEGQPAPDVAVLPVLEEDLSTVTSADLPPGHQLVYERLTYKRIETGEIIQDQISGQWSEFAHQRAARPYTKLSSDEPWIYHEEVRSEPVDDDVINVIALSAGREHHTCAVTYGGGVKCWGKNEIGRASCRERV